MDGFRLLCCLRDFYVLSLSWMWFSVSCTCTGTESRVLSTHVCAHTFKFHISSIHTHAHTNILKYIHVPTDWLPCPIITAHTDPNGLSPRQIKSDSDDDDLPNVTLDSVNETGSTALSIARAVQEWVLWSLQVWRMMNVINCLITAPYSSQKKILMSLSQVVISVPSCHSKFLNLTFGLVIKFDI